MIQYNDSIMIHDVALHKLRAQLFQISAFMFILNCKMFLKQIHYKIMCLFQTL